MKRYQIQDLATTIYREHPDISAAKSTAISMCVYMWLKRQSELKPTKSQAVYQQWFGRIRRVRTDNPGILDMGVTPPDGEAA